MAIQKIISFPRSGLTFIVRDIAMRVPEFRFCEGYKCRDAFFKEVNCNPRGIRPPIHCSQGRIVKDHDNFLLVRKGGSRRFLVLTRRNILLAFSSLISLKLRTVPSRWHPPMQVFAAFMFTPYLVAFHRKWLPGSGPRIWPIYYYEDLASDWPHLASDLLDRGLEESEEKILTGMQFEPTRLQPLAALRKSHVARQIQFWERRSFITLWSANLLGRLIFAAVRRLVSSGRFAAAEAQRSSI